MNIRCKCGQEYEVDDSSVGQVGVCEKCGAEFVVSKMAEPPPIPKKLKWNEGRNNRTAIVILIVFSAFMAWSFYDEYQKNKMAKINERNRIENEAAEKKRLAEIESRKTPEQKEAEKAAEESARRSEKLKSGFSAWDGSHFGLVKYVKNSMNDPDSFKHVETKLIEDGKTNIIIVGMTFRGKNAFGAVVKNKIVVKADLDGNILEVLTTE